MGAKPTWREGEAIVGLLLCGFGGVEGGVGM